jgi:hypothetical protein
MSGEVSDEIKSILDNFIKHLQSMGVSARQISRLCYGYSRSELNSIQLKQSPERLVEEQLVWPILRALGYNFITEAYCSEEGVNFDLMIYTDKDILFGEVKKLGYIKDAEWDIIQYLGKGMAQTNVGLATDGLIWNLFAIDLEFKIGPRTTLQYFSFARYIHGYLYQNEGYEVEDDWMRKFNPDDVDLDAEIDKFVNGFCPASMSGLPTE